MMKTFKLLTLLLAITALGSCEKDEPIFSNFEITEENSIPKADDLPEEEPTSLTFTVQTTEDQMGPFAKNAMIEFNGKVWSVGGINAYSSPNLSSDVWSSDNGKNWVSVTSNLFDERKGHTLTKFDNKMWLIGGVNDAGCFLEDVWYSTDGTSWTLATDTPAYLSTAYHSTVVFNNRLYIIKDGSDGFVEVWSSADGITWNIETDQAFSNREEFEAIVFNTAIYVIGGKHVGTSFNEVWKSTDGVDWNLITPSDEVFSPRYALTATVHNGKVWIVGGVTGTFSETQIDFWYSDDMVEWIAYDGTPPATEGLIYHSALSYSDELWLFGGLQPNTLGEAPMTGEIRSIHEE
jgi:hypothetical protein